MVPEWKQAVDLGVADSRRNGEHKGRHGAGGNSPGRGRQPGRLRGYLPARMRGRAAVRGAADAGCAPADQLPAYLGLCVFNVDTPTLALLCVLCMSRVWAMVE